MAATVIETMSQSNGFQSKKKEDVDNKDNLWYVQRESSFLGCFVQATLTIILHFFNARIPIPDNTYVPPNTPVACLPPILRVLRGRVYSNRYISVAKLVCIYFFRSSILAEVQNSGNNKLPSNKNVLVLGKIRREDDA